MLTLRRAGAAAPILLAMAHLGGPIYAQEPLLAPVPTIVIGAEPASGERGDLVTVRGVFLFGVRATIGGVPAPVVSEDVSEVVLLVPEVPAGPAPIRIVTGLTGSGTAAFTVIEGVLLSGALNRPALEALVDDPPLAVLPAEIDLEGVLLTRLDAVIRPQATVGEVNDALRAEGARITSMEVGNPFVTLSIPRQADVAAMEAVGRRLKASSAFNSTSPGQTRRPAALPEGDARSAVEHLSASRFPAAWNARSLVDGNCTPVRVVVPDYFGPTPPTGFLREFPPRGCSAQPGSSCTYQNSRGADAPVSTHGWDVLTTLAADDDAEAPTGAVPLPECLAVTALEVGNISSREADVQIARSLGGGEGATILSTSLTFFPKTIHAGNATENNAAVLARLVFLWHQLTENLTDRFVHFTASGNERDKQSGQTYRGVNGKFSDFAFVAFGGDPRFAADTFLWEPQAEGAPSLVASAENMAELEILINALGVPDPVPPRENVVVVGSVDPSGSFSAFSNLPDSVTAVGEEIPILGGDTTEGTSSSTPIVAGLAAWLWLLSPELRSSPPAETARLVANTSGFNGLVDAYAATLALDDGARGLFEARIRRAIADSNGDAAFDEVDVLALRKAISGESRILADDRRADLNGDGKVGPTDGTAAIDVDPTGSPRFGAPRLVSFSVDVNGANRTVDEHAATDLDVLCAWAYSPLFSGDENERNQLLDQHCSWATLRFVRERLPLATIDEAYDVEDLVHATVPYDLVLSSGALPPGLTLGDSGIHGTPTRVGAYRIELEAVNETLDLVDRRTYDLYVVPAGDGAIFARANTMTTSSRTSTSTSSSESSKAANSSGLAEDGVPIAESVSGSYAEHSSSTSRRAALPDPSCEEQGSTEASGPAVDLETFRVHRVRTNVLPTSLNPDGTCNRTTFVSEENSFEKPFPTSLPCTATFDEHGLVSRECSAAVENSPCGDGCTQSVRYTRTEQRLRP